MFGIVFSSDFYWYYKHGPIMYITAIHAGTTNMGL